jgi:hypothetical protein
MDRDGSGSDKCFGNISHRPPNPPGVVSLESSHPRSRTLLPLPRASRPRKLCREIRILQACRVPDAPPRLVGHHPSTSRPCDHSSVPMLFILRLPWAVDWGRVSSKVVGIEEKHKNQSEATNNRERERDRIGTITGSLLQNESGSPPPFLHTHDQYLTSGQRNSNKAYERSSSS